MDFGMRVGSSVVITTYVLQDLTHASAADAPCARGRAKLARSFMVALCCGLALALCASCARATDDWAHKYRTLAPGVRWSGVMSWYYAPAGQPAWASTLQMTTLIQQAMNAWSSHCGVQFAFLGTTEYAATVEDGASIIGWLPAMAYSGNTSWYMRAGVMVEADIQLNASANGSAAMTIP